MKHIKFAIMNEYGEIDVVYGDEESLHCVLLTEYIKSKGLIKDNVTLDFNDPNNLSLFLREQGKVVFLNTTNYRKITKYGKSGIVIIPDDFLEKQKENLIKLNEYISDFVEMQIWYDFSTRTQCRNLYAANKTQVSTVLEYFLKEICNKSRKKICVNKTK